MECGDLSPLCCFREVSSPLGGSSPTIRDHVVSQVAMQIKPLCLSKNNNSLYFTLPYTDCPVHSDGRSKKETGAGPEAESSTREHAVSQLATDSDDARPIRPPAILSAVALPAVAGLAKVDGNGGSFSGGGRIRHSFSEGGWRADRNQRRVTLRGLRPSGSDEPPTPSDATGDNNCRFRRSRSSGRCPRRAGCADRPRAGSR